MQTDPSKAEPPKRKRRFFQFRLRTLMIVVSVFCVMVGVGTHLGWRSFISEYPPSTGWPLLYTGMSKST